MEGDQIGRVTTSQTTFDVLDAVKRLEEACVTDVANELGLAKSTAHRHLTTLHDNEFLVRDGDAYHLSFRFLDLGEYVRGRRPLYRMASRKVKEVAEETGERAQFMVEEHGRAVYIHVALGDHAVQTDSGLGRSMPMTAVSAGKAMLAFMPRDRVEAILDRRGLPRRTEATVTDRAALFEELDRIAERGYALNDGESTRGLRAVSVPVRGPDGQVGGALGVSGPTHRFREDRFRSELPEYLLGIGNELELDVQYR